MDDYNVSVLSEAKSEYSLRLVTILYPLILEGIKSILKEAWELCLTNDEEEKYLMTFQNFLSRVTKWNQTIIDEETNRILSKSRCAYLEDLLTCVHITQLKILTSIRVSQKQKKIDLDIPRLSDFIHKIYIKCARKFYSNVYLFEQKIMPLQYQKNMRECETICKECIINVIRDNMPVEHILRSYMDESIEEEIIEETVPISKDQSEETVKDLSENTVSTQSSEDAKPAEKTDVIIDKVTDVSAVSVTTETKADVSVPEIKGSEISTPNKILTPENIKVLQNEIISKVPVVETVPKAQKLAPESVPKASPLLSVVTEPQSPKKLSFDNVDKVFDRQTLQEKLVEAPKTIDRLEEISKMRTAQRKAEEEEEDNIKIHTEDAKIDLEIMQL